ncbi:MAG TPA: response regulator [Diaminobutyricibacter sp.]
MVGRNGAKAAARLRVLIADDEQAIRLMCRVNLELDGIEVIEAADGVEAVGLALARQPDVAILDIRMPLLDGWQVADRLRASPATSAVALIFLTAETGDDAKARARERGALLIGKPFNPLQLAVIAVAAAATRKSAPAAAAARTKRGATKTGGSSPEPPSDT